jgi:hypothetical protein
MQGIQHPVEVVAHGSVRIVSMTALAIAAWSLLSFAGVSAAQAQAVSPPSIEDKRFSADPIRSAMSRSMGNKAHEGAAQSTAEEIAFGCFSQTARMLPRRVACGNRRSESDRQGV